MRQAARVHLEDIVAALDGPKVGEDITAAEWREILDEVMAEVAARLDCLNEEEGSDPGEEEPNPRYPR